MCTVVVKRRLARCHRFAQLFRVQSSWQSVTKVSFIEAEIPLRRHESFVFLPEKESEGLPVLIGKARELTPCYRDIFALFLNQREENRRANARSSGWEPVRPSSRFDDVIAFEWQFLAPKCNTVP